MKHQTQPKVSERTVPADWRMTYPRPCTGSAVQHYLEGLSDLWEGWDKIITLTSPWALRNPDKLLMLIDEPGTVVGSSRRGIPARVRLAMGLADSPTPPPPTGWRPSRSCFEYLLITESVKRCSAKIALSDDSSCTQEQVVSFIRLEQMQLAGAYRHLLQNALEQCWDTDMGFAERDIDGGVIRNDASDLIVLRRVLDYCDKRFRDIVCCAVNNGATIEDLPVHDWVQGVYLPEPVDVPVQQITDQSGVRLRPTKAEIAPLLTQGHKVPELWVTRAKPVPAPVDASQGTTVEGNKAPAKRTRRKHGRPPATREERNTDQSFLKKWQEAQKQSSVRLTIKDFAKIHKLDPRVVKRALDRQRKRDAALREARR